MLIRNAQYLRNGGIDCEINHPQHGWIPYTATPDGADLLERLVFESAQADAAPYVPDPEQDLANARARKIAEINEMYVASIKPLIREYPDIEQATWLAQEREARAYLEWEEFGAEGEPAPPMPVLDNILIGRNGEDGTETMQQLCLAVLENADLFAAAQQLTGKRQRLEKLAKAAEAIEEIELISW
ncbi:hypothetical protein [Halomonas sp. KHS3]|uniref:hypothetical protein n=1 Tax=Halomonas sp. KHS3 TaxID=866350 RepID=UPI00069807E4|nr:hypothetical protein [Halomonas sp. KHS3]